MDQILADAKSLAQRLQYHDSAADSLISDAANLQTKLHGMKEVYIHNNIQNYLFFESPLGKSASVNAAYTAVF